MNLKRNFFSGLMTAVMLVGMFTGISTNAQADTIPQTITFDLSSQTPKTYGDTAFDPGATAESGLQVSYSSSNLAVATVSGSTVTIIGAGTAIITASQDGDAAYAAATPVTQTLTVNKRAITVTADTMNKIYGDSVQLSYTITSGSLVSGDNFTGQLDRGPGENVGIYAITQGGLELNANYALTFVGSTFTVTPRPITVTAGAMSKIYGESVALPYTITSGSLVSGDNCSLDRDPGENVGTYAITPGSLALNANYALTFVGAIFTINPRPITVTADAKSKAFSYFDPPLTYQITSGSLVVGDNFAGSLDRLSGEELGTYAIHKGTLSLSTNYILTYQSADLTIDKGTPTITALPTASKIIFGQALSASTLTGGFGTVPGSFTFTAPGAIPSAGSYNAAITYMPTDMTHYNIASGTVTVAVGMLDSVRIKRGTDVIGNYSFIEDAFAVPPIDGDIIEMLSADHFIGELLCNSNIAITLKGGFDTLFSANTNPSSALHGTLTLKQGTTLSVEKLVLRSMQ